MSKQINIIKDNLQARIKKNGAAIAAHRGTNGGNIVQNTLPSYLNAIAQGADIIEMDVARTIDGVFYCFHDGQEPLILRAEKNIKTMTSAEVDSFQLINSVNHHVNEKVNRLSDVLPRLKGQNCFINIDRSWSYWEDVLKELDQYEMYDQLFIKSPVKEELFHELKNSNSPIAYMPIIKTYEELEYSFSHPHNMIAVELVFDSEDNPIVSADMIKKIKAEELFVWGNAIRLDDRKILAAGYDDDHAILESMEGNWGWFLNHGFDIIQTDWPLLMKGYLDSRK